MAMKRVARNTLRRLHPRELANGIWAVPAVFLMRALRPIVLFRLGTLSVARIGHFIVDGGEQLARLQQQPANTVDWFWLGKTCNSQWERMIRRNLPVYDWVRYLDWWNKVIPGGSEHVRPGSYTGSRDLEGLYARYDVKIPFLPAETDEALAWLRGKGWRDGEPFVCLLVRDNEYLIKDSFQEKVFGRSADAWSYHDYRNSDIDSYVPAVQWLAKQGVWVIRMGKLMAKPLPTDMDHVIDYAFDRGKSDLLDIWLFANCTGCVCTSTGPDELSMLYDRPILSVNALPLGLFLSWSRSIFVPKILQWTATGRDLSIGDYLANNWTRTNDYKSAGISIVDLSPEEIVTAVQEFWQRVSETWQSEPEDQKRQDEFWKICKQWPSFSKYHGWRHPDARVGESWLRSMAHEADVVESKQKAAGQQV
jgi:putative glycosyltransferase (TIGR04372 family)